MSYSFSVKGATKAEVIQTASVKFDEVIVTQPSHAADKDAAIAAATAFVNILTDPAPGEHIHLSVHGSLSWIDSDQKMFHSAGVGISAGIAKD